MAVEIITKEDLNNFKIELLAEIKTLIKDNPLEEKVWLKSPEVRKMLGISTGTLQNLRINGTLSYTKIGGILYYSYEDIQKVLHKNKRDFRK